MFAEEEDVFLHKKMALDREPRCVFLCNQELLAYL